MKLNTVHIQIQATIKTLRHIGQDNYQIGQTLCDLYTSADLDTFEGDTSQERDAIYAAKTVRIYRALDT